MSALLSKFKHFAASISQAMRGSPRPGSRERVVAPLNLNRFFIQVEALEQRNLPSAGLSSSLGVTNFSLTAPPPPDVTAVAQSPTQVELTWPSVPTASSYTVQQWIPDASYGSLGGYWWTLPSQGASINYQVNNLEPDTNYQFDVSANNSAGSTMEPQVTWVATPLPVLSATTLSNASVNLAWASLGNLQYEVDEQLANGSWPELLGGGASGGTSDQVNGLAAGTSYNFRLGWAGPVGSFDVPYGYESFPVSTTLPAAVTLSTTQTTATSATLNWTSAGPATVDYKVYELNELPGTTQVYQTLVADAGTSTSATISGLNSYTSYYFQVSAAGPAGTTWSGNGGTPELSNVVGAMTKPAAATLSATATSSSAISLNWTTVMGATDYQVFQVVNGQAPSLVYDAKLASSYTVSGLSSYTSYTYEIATWGAWGVTWSNAPGTYTLPASLSLSGGGLSTAANLMWNSVNGVYDYTIFEYQPASGYYGEVSTQSSGNFASVSNLVPNTQYEFQVEDLGAWGTTSSNWVTIDTNPVSPNFTATPMSSTQININWNFAQYGTVSDNFYLEVRNNSTSTYQVISLGSGLYPPQNYPISGLALNTSYTLYAWSTNPSGYGFSNIVTVSTFPAPPTLTLTPASTSQINFSWTSLPGVNGYAVQELVNGSWQTLTTVAQGVASYSLTSGLTANSSYTFRVGAEYAAGTNWSSSQTTMTLPLAPTFTLTACPHEEISVNINAVAGLTYLIDVYQNGILQEAVPTTGSDLLTGLAADTDYTIVVYAFNEYQSLGTSESIWTLPYFIVGK